MADWYDCREENSVRRTLRRNVGRVCTVFTTAGGCAGGGFTGLVANVNDDSCKVITALPAADELRPFGPVNGCGCGRGDGGCGCGRGDGGCGCGRGDRGCGGRSCGCGNGNRGCGRGSRGCGCGNRGSDCGGRSRGDVLGTSCTIPIDQITCVATPEI